MNILIGISGSISAYKTLDIISMLRKSGHVVRVIMTESAEMFVTEMSLAVISTNPVIKDWSGDLQGCVEHVDIAEWADVMLIAPLTANTMSKMINGNLDNPLLCAYSVFVGKKGYDKLILAPAMNTHMYSMMEDMNHIGYLRSEGVRVITPQIGILACGELGAGKLADINVVVNIVNGVCGLSNDDQYVEASVRG